MNVRILLLISVVALIVACATSPTGRRQLLLLSDSQVDQMGIAAYAQMREKQKVSGEAVVNSYVNCVADALLVQVVGGPRLQWEVTVFDEKSANAFALPGGKIGVHTGILQVAQTADQLAAVIGHEIGHVLARHGNERMSIAYASQASQELMGVMLGGNAAAAQMMSVLGLGAQLGVQLPFSRAHETEADLMGLMLMARAGFDPQASVELWQEMARREKSSKAPPELLSTHPAKASRISFLREHMGSALQLYNEAQRLGKRPGCRPG